MKKLIWLFFLCSSIIFSQINFEEYFTNETLRFDFYHTGNKDNEIISFEKLVKEQLWAGSKKNLIDTFNYGNYMLKVYDEAENKLIYSRGFSTLFQEWQTTEEAKNVWRSFEGSL
ncbi:MAG: peptidase M64 N-terminal domain-containing protein, partial [Melioribacter sp.]|nr:peptidase M64 N-terminal domain-containing protein [Melioribacter sp.]